jgi:hypothetical protein
LTARSRLAAAASLAARVALLFALGVGYGVLVSRLSSDRDLGSGASFAMEGLMPRAAGAKGLDTLYLAFWGVAGVALGGLLPWFDGVWENTFGRQDGKRNGESSTGGKAAGPEIDWALVVRGIGAFVGIIFAIVRGSPPFFVSAFLCDRLTGSSSSASFRGPPPCRYL